MSGKPLVRKLAGWGLKFLVNRMMPDPAVRGMAEKNDPFWPKDDKYNSPEGVQNLINMK